MSHPIWLIAAREFRTYAATASFWIALALGPLLMGGALFLAAASAPRFGPTASLTLSTGQGAGGQAGGVQAQFSDGFPLSANGRSEVLRILEREGRVAGPISVKANAEPAISDLRAIPRFALVMLLWITLTGSLGMLLQAVVRERANRALESLLAAARPLDIALGKLVGVGAVSVLVLSVWLGSAMALGSAAPASSGAAAVLLRGLADPAGLARVGLIYILGFGFYGMTTVAVGAMARDNADAQNLARPMFAVLLAVFFTVMSTVQGGAAGLAWLAFLPPFTPFMLLMAPQPAAVEALALALLALATAGAGALAVRVLKVERVSLVPMRWRRRA